MPDRSDPFDLERFVEAQEDAYSQAVSELRRGRKTGHWMWFIFPQLRGLGQSAMAHQYGITSREEARAYLDHALLGARLVECTKLVVAVEGMSIHSILGSPDDLKFRSCMTLFQAVAPAEPPFSAALAKYFEDRPDERTLGMLSTFQA